LPTPPCLLAHVASLSFELHGFAAQPSRSVWHCSPLQPPGHAHLCWPVPAPSLEQVAPFLHGAFAQSSKSCSQVMPDHLGPA